MKLTGFIGYLLFFSFLTACSEDKDEIPPNITILLPTENRSFGVRDTVIIVADIDDNEKIKEVVVRFVSEETGNVVLPSRVFNPTGKTYRLDLTYEISDSLLKSGRYYFEVQASDGENEFSAFRFVRLNGLPQQKINTLVFCSDGSSTFVYKGDKQFNFTQRNVFGFDFLTAVFNSDDQHLWIFPKGNNDLQVQDLNDFTQSRVLSYPSSASQTFSSVKRDEREIYFTLTDGEVAGLGNLFGRIYTYLSPGSRVTEALAVGEKNILLEERDVTGGSREIKVLFRSSGALDGSISFTNDIVDFVILNEKEAFVFYNDAQGGRIAEFDIDGANYRNLSLTMDSITSVLATNSNEILIATTIDVQQFRISDFNVFSYDNTAGAIMAYDPLNNQLYLADDKTLRLYDYRNKSLLASNNFSFPVKGITIRYNRN